jgi:hypothetical protein
MFYFQFSFVFCLFVNIFFSIFFSFKCVYLNVLRKRMQDDGQMEWKFFCFGMWCQKVLSVIWIWNLNFWRKKMRSFNLFFVFQEHYFTIWWTSSTLYQLKKALKSLNFSFFYIFFLFTLSFWISINIQITQKLCSLHNNENTVNVLLMPIVWKMFYIIKLWPREWERHYIFK